MKKNLSWLVESYTERENTERLVESIKLQDYKCVNALQIPSFMGVDDFFPKDSYVLAHTCIDTAREIFYKKSWYPGVFCNFKEYKCSQYYPVLSKYLFNEDYLMMPYGDILRRKEFIFDTLGSNDCIFLRPDSGFKVFTGTLLEKERFEKDFGNLGYGDIDPHELVVVAYPRNIKREWRLFATKEGVITGSQYKEGNNGLRTTDVPKDVWELADEIAKFGGYYPDPVFSVDICESKSGDLYLLEMGCFSSSGIYMADTDKLVEVASDEAMKSIEETLS